MLSLDIETHSDIDLIECGVYRYVEGRGFTVLLLASAWDNEEVRLIDLTSEPLPAELRAALLDNSVIKTAYNANFEITCLSKYLGATLDPSAWCCTAVHAATLGLPRSLADVAKALRMPEQKDRAGKDLIKYFSVPCKPTQTNEQRTRNLPEHAPEKWEQFKAYCVQDVVVEREVRRRLEKYPVPPIEQAAWEMDQRINARGVGVDTAFVRQAIRMSDEHTEALTQEATALTGLDNPNSVTQLKRWLGVEKLTKDSVKELRALCPEPTVDRVLAIRQEMGKTSVSKYEAAERMTCEDGRIRGMFKFYGASRTGRWSGSGIQPQNLPSNKVYDLETAREAVMFGDREWVQTLFDNVPDTLSELIRTALVPKPGHKFVVADFSAIEARVLSWYAGERWRMNVFAGHGKIYEASAEQMFNLRPGSVKKGDPMRQRGKTAELGLGYSGSAAALVRMGALKNGLKEEELPGLVSAWRAANPAIVACWNELDKAAMDAVRYQARVPVRHGVVWLYENKILHMILPSGRALRYVRPRIVDGKYDEVIEYSGMDTGKWGRKQSWRGIWIENLCQALARDCLRDAMLAVEQRYPDIVLHVHDELVVEVPEREASVALLDICEIMGRPVPWAPGLLLRGDGFVTDFYRKD